MPNKRSDGFYTVWDTGFGLRIAPTEPMSHPHLNMAIVNETQMSFRPPADDTPNWDKEWKNIKDKAWKICNKLNHEYAKNHEVSNA